MKIRLFLAMLFCAFVGVGLTAVGWRAINSAPQELKNNLANVRITLIDDAGNVLLDNQSPPEKMSNHADRPEIIAALTDGVGRDERYSATQRENTYYYAVKVAPTRILRLSLTEKNITAFNATLIAGLTAIALGALLAALLAARWLTRKIIAPLNHLDLNAEEFAVYDELAPLIGKIKTQRREIAAHITALTARADTIKTITENMQEGLILLDRRENVLTANPSACVIFGRSLNDCGKNLVEWTRVAPILDGVRRVLVGDEVNDYVWEKAHRYYQIIFSAAREFGAVLLILDITAKAQSERLRREFSANVSHELKTPLSVISGYAEMIENNLVKPADLNSCAQKIRQESERLLTLIGDIIKLSQLDESPLALRNERVDLTALTQEVSALLAPLIEQHAIKIQLSQTPITLNVNRQLLFELLWNVIHNAIIYNHPEGEVIVDLRQERNLDDTNATIIEVRDTGIGIPQEDIDRVFERFYRVAKSRSKKSGGTGLGLSIVKHIAELHGGSASVKSELGKGSVFTIRL